MTKKCPNCGYELPEEASFCLHCFSIVNSRKSIEIKTNVNLFNKKKIWVSIIAVFIITIVSASVAFSAYSSTLHRKLEKENQTTNSITTSTTSSSTSTSSATTATSATTTTETPTTTEVSTEASTQESTTNTTTQEKTTSKRLFDYVEVENGVRITKYLGNEETVVIPNKIKNKKVVEIDYKTFSNNSKIRTIKFSNTNSSCYISSNAFYDLKNLQALYLPNNFSCGSFSDILSGCNRLKTIIISNGGNCKYKSTNSVVYNDSTLVYYPSAKTNSEFTIPNYVTKIEKNAFKSNKYLESIKFSKNESFNCDWKNLFSSLENLNTIIIYAGTNADLIGMQYFDGEIVYYDWFTKEKNRWIITGITIQKHWYSGVYKQ